jgi:hypothetical protein
MDIKDYYLESMTPTPFEEFHLGLYSQSVKLSSPPFLIHPRDLLGSSQVHERKLGTFTPGHEIIFNRCLKFPLVGISMYDSKEVAQDKVKTLLWLTPIEQALLVADKRSYCRKLAILDPGWGKNYDKLALGMVPSGKVLRAAVGLTAPQWVPKKLFDHKTYSSGIFTEGTLMQFEPGGSIQIYITHCAKMKWVEIDAVQGGNIRVAEGLHDLGLISEEERDFFVDFRNTWNNLERAS